MMFGLQLSPEEIYFSHDSIGSRFSCGRYIEDTYKELRDGEIHISVIPRMTVTAIDGEWFAWNGNRRLWVYKKLAFEGKLRRIQVLVTDKNILKKRFTTEDDGRSIEVRHRRDLAFPPHQGPNLWARFLSNSTQQSFLDSAPSGGIASLALSYDQSGYFYSTEGEDRDWKYRRIPEEVANLIDRKESHSVDPSYVALGPGGRYFVKFDDGSWQWHGSPSFNEALQKASRRNETIYEVAFAPRGGWWISMSSGSKWDGLPKTLHKTLQKADVEADFVSVSAAGNAWCVEFPGFTTWDGLDEECQKAVDDGGLRVSRITFGCCHVNADDDVVIEFFD